MTLHRVAQLPAPHVDPGSPSSERPPSWPCEFTFFSPLQKLADLVFRMQNNRPSLRGVCVRSGRIPCHHSWIWTITAGGFSLFLPESARTNSVLCGGDAGSDELPPHKNRSGGQVDETPHAAMDPVWIAWSMCCHGSCVDSLEHNTIYPFSMSVAVYYLRSVILNVHLVPPLNRRCFFCALLM